mgnify:CR=1 FL=1
MTKELFSPHAMAKMAMCVALISIGGYIAFPTPFSLLLILLVSTCFSVMKCVRSIFVVHSQVIFSLRNRAYCVCNLRPTCSEMFTATCKIF